MGTRQVIQEFIVAIPEVIREHVRAQLGRQVQHTLTPKQAEQLNRWPGRSYREGKVVSGRITGMSVSDGSEYVNLDMADGDELNRVPFKWTDLL
ncbi:hypothetical protein [Micromonospora chersina]|uniref:hypothetical protein n=1 Tax=Micromonospora chersina TaxID=47854 RepID=UPI0036AB53F8